MDKFVLYRGDYEEIHEFDFKKTSKYCYVGPGIYLSTSLKVAESYRTKGARTADRPRTLFEGMADNRDLAIAKAFPTFFDGHFVPAMIEKYGGSRKKIPRGWTDLALTRYKELVAERTIVADYVSVNYAWQPKPKQPTLRVVFNFKEVDGFVTKFEFDRTPFLGSVINVHRVCDPVVWEIAYDNKLSIGKQHGAREEYLRSNINSSILDSSLTSSKSTLSSSRFRSVLLSYGYKGFEYHGGTVIGGFGPHRAFCIWDDEFVNQHRVLRLK